MERAESLEQENRRVLEYEQKGNTLITTYTVLGKVRLV